MNTCHDCGEPTPREGDDGRPPVCDDCYVPPAVKPCEMCGKPTTAEAPFGFMCAGCCFAESH
jgi:hypothetical protein